MPLFLFCEIVTLNNTSGSLGINRQGFLLQGEAGRTTARTINGLEDDGLDT